MAGRLRSRRIAWWGADPEGNEIGVREWGTSSRCSDRSSPACRRLLAAIWPSYDDADVDRPCDVLTIGGMVTSGYSIQPLTAHTWNAFAGLVERHNGIFGGCRCIYFHPDCAERGQGYEGNRALKKRLVEAGQAHAALVMVGDDAIAWAEYGTPDELPTIHHRKQYLAEADVIPDYRITCIFVDKRHRGQGYDKAALAGALDLVAA